MKTLLFDSDVVIDILRGKRETMDQLFELMFGHSLVCSVITVAEVYAGMFPREEVGTDAILESLTKIPVSETIAKAAGKLRFEHPRLGMMDCLIAATALLRGAHLLTKNVKHYPMKGLQLIQIK